LANVITYFRILFSAVLLFCPALSVPFYTLYLTAGFSDMLDGAVARRTGTASKLGARLDTVADFVFTLVCLIKLLPVMSIPGWLYIWIIVISLIKGINIVSGYVMQKRFVTVHTAANKAAGAFLFILPLIYSFVELKIPAVLACGVATFAAIQEGRLIRTGVQNGG